MDHADALSDLLGVRQCISASIVVNGYEALLNVNVGCAVLAHGAQLHQVAVCRQKQTPTPHSRNVSRPSQFAVIAGVVATPLKPIALSW